MPLERDYVVLLGPKPRQFDGKRTRNVELQPCGCWAGEVWRAPMSYNTAKGEFEPGTAFAWQLDTGQCGIHSAAVVVLQLALSARLAQQNQLLVGQKGDAPPQRVSEEAFFAKLGDGAKRLWSDRQNVLAKADALNEEIKALGTTIPKKQLPPKGKL